MEELCRTPTWTNIAFHRHYDETTNNAAANGTSNGISNGRNGHLTRA